MGYGGELALMRSLGIPVSSEARGGGAEGQMKKRFKKVEQE